MYYLKKPKFISAFFDVQGCTNAAGSWMSRSVDVQGCTNVAITWM